MSPAFESLGVPERRSVLKSRLSKAQEKAVSVCHKLSKRDNQPAWLNREILAELNKGEKNVSSPEAR